MLLHPDSSTCEDLRRPKWDRSTAISCHQSDDISRKNWPRGGVRRLAVSENVYMQLCIFPSCFPVVSRAVLLPRPSSKWYRARVWSRTQIARLTGAGLLSSDERCWKYGFRRSCHSKTCVFRHLVQDWHGVSRVSFCSSNSLRLACNVQIR